MKKIISTNMCAGLSLLMHMIIVLCIILYWVKQAKLPSMNDQALPIYTTPVSAIPSKNNISKKVTDKGLSQSHDKTISASQSSLPQQQSMDVNDNPVHRELLKLLHNEIASKQVYPQSALALNQVGSVTIRFVLTPVGDVKNILIIHSSGFTSLDDAAKAAVLAIAPYDMAKQYLTSEEEFVINIRFKED